MADRGWSFEWRRTWDEVFDPPFVARWNALRAADPLTSVYHRPEVVRAWAETCGDATGCQPLFGVALHDGVTIVLPWVVSTNRGRLLTRRVIEAVGQDLFGYHDPIVASPVGAALSWGGFWDAVRVATAPFGHQGFLRSVSEQCAGSSAIPAESAPILQLHGAKSLDSLLAACSANHRGDIQRRFRRLAERGPVTLHAITAGSATASAVAIFNDLCAAYEQRREERPHYPSLDRPGFRDLLQRTATRGVAEGWGHLSVLSVGSEPVAWHLGLFDRQALYWWMPTHARAFEPLSPGKVLLASLVDRGIESGWRAIHFLTGAQQYKLAWRPEMSPRRGIRWHSPTLVGTVLHRYDARAAV